MVTHQKLFPGTLKVARCSSMGRNLVYTRNQDKKLFRIAGPDFESGPLIDEEHGRLLTLETLFDGTILAAQYRPYPKSTEFKVILSIFTKSSEGHGDWKRKVLWEISLHGLGDDMIEPDSLHLMYFLTTPILKADNTKSIVVFVFLGRIFTLEKLDDWALRADRIDHYLSGTELDVDLISLINYNGDEKNPTRKSEHQVALVSDVFHINLQSKEIFLFTNNHNPKSIFREYIGWLFSSSHTTAESDLVFRAVTGFDFFFDIPEVLHINVGNEINLPLFNWHLLGTWSTPMVGLPKTVIQINEKIVGLTNLETKLFILLDDGSVYTLNTAQKTSSLPDIEFFLNRWILWLTLLLMVFIFSIYEMTPTNPRSTIALSSLLYIGVLLLTFATVFIEL